MAAVVTTPHGDIDLWAPVVRDALRKALVDAMEQRDWTTVRAQLGNVMDGITNDGVYGRALLQLAFDLPVGTDPVFDSYRAAASIDHGDWDGLRRCLASSPIEPIQLLGMRDVLLAPLNQVAPKAQAPRTRCSSRPTLGAANRTEAAVKLEELDGPSPRLS